MKQNITGLTRMLILTVVSLSLALSGVDVISILIALPKIQLSLHATNGQLQWIMNGFLLGMGVMSIIAGQLSDRYGYFATLLSGVLALSLTSLGCALSSSPNEIILFRIAQGMSVVLLSIPVRALIFAIAPKGREGKMVALSNSLMLYMFLLGPTVAITLMHIFSWRAIFSLNIIVSALVAWALLLSRVSLRTIHNKHPAADHRIDIRSLVFLALASLAMVYSATIIHTDPIMAFMSLLISVLLFYACYVLVKRHDGGVIDFNWMLSKKQILNIILISFSQSVIIATLYLSNFIQQIVHFSQNEIIGLVSVLVVSFIAGSKLSGLCYDRYGFKKTCLLGLFAYCVGNAIGFMLLTQHVFMAFVFLTLGLGFGSFMVNTAVGVSSLLSAGERSKGVAAGVMGWARQCGGALVYALIMTIFNFKSKNKLHSLIHQKGVSLSAKHVAQVLASPLHVNMHGWGVISMAALRHDAVVAYQVGVTNQLAAIAFLALVFMMVVVWVWRGEAASVYVESKHDDVVV